MAGKNYNADTSAEGGDNWSDTPAPPNQTWTGDVEAKDQINEEDPGQHATVDQSD